MKSTGEVMGMDVSFGIAFAKAQLAAGMRLPEKGKVFISVRDGDKERIALVARRLHRLGFQIVATRGTADYFERRGIPTERINKVQEGSPDAAEAIQNGEIAMVINTPQDAYSQADSYLLRRNALDYQVAYFTTIAGAEAAAEGIAFLKERDFDVQPLQEYHARNNEPASA
jgi:carbamoyl-phosphate synthase large subunit